MAVDLAKARRQFEDASEGTRDQEQREMDDLGFYEGDTQWPEDIKTLRAGQQAQNSMPAVPARPCLTINKVRDPIRRIQNDELQADIGMSIIPADDFLGDVDENEIELREGLARRIQRNSNAQDARMWAANRAAICGRGYYGILTQFVKGTLDQEVIYRRFYNQFSVKLDPFHEQPDASDIEYAFVARDVPWDVYRADYPRLADGSTKNPTAADSMSDSEWDAMAETTPGWIKRDGKSRAVRVSEYWYFTREEREIVRVQVGPMEFRDVDRSEVPDDLYATIDDLNKRSEVVKRVKFAIIDGVNTLRETDWPGQFIPIIKVVGEEMQVYDQQRRFEGLVRPARGSQTAYNVMVSTAVETIGLAPKAPFVVYAGQLEGYEDMWKQAGVRNWPYLVANAMTDATGQQVLNLPQRQQGEPANIQAMAMMMAAFDQGIMATIGQANLADTHPDVRSGDMANTIIDDAARGTSNYLANLIRSVHYEGAIVNDLLYPIYGIRPGRIVSLMNSAQKTERVMIGAPFVLPTATAMPQKFNPSTHNGMQPQTYQLTKGGSFNVAIEVNRFYETKKQERAALLVGMIEKSPEQLPIIGDLAMEALGYDERSERYKAVLDPRVVAMLKEGQPPDPRLQQAEQVFQALTQELQQLKADKHARIEQSMIKAQSDAVTTDADNAAKIKVAEINSTTQIAIAEIKNAIAEQSSVMKQLLDAEKLRQEQMRTMEKFVEERRLSDDRTHDMGMAHLKHVHAMTQADQEHEHALSETSHEAAVMPTPTKGTNGSGR